ncbi:MAG: glycosyltransferase family 2 protein [Ruminiclostridium sp.]|nr:glycosyltransferase family 2 protein [Ruminiclostridium sp.]
MSSENVPEHSTDLSVIMPCLNEEKTAGACIDEAKRFISSHGLNAEIIVVDNGSTDNSVKTAEKHGASVIREPRRGYGRAIRTGIEHSRGKVVIFGDCDTTYDFFHLEGFYFPLERGEYDVMIGDRFRGGIEKGAMPALHRLGVPFLSWCGRLKFRTDVRDFHCGLRALTREAAEKAVFHTDGMEFATEMIGECTRKGLRIGQTPTKLRKCVCERVSKLHTFSDGFRHLKYILTAII